MIALAIRLIAAIGVPERHQKVAAWGAIILAALALLSIAKCSYDRAVIREHEREIVEEVREKTERGNAAATEAVRTTKADVEESNRRASEAARDSDDPLKRALEELRR